jgi:hypothetical protein
MADSCDETCNRPDDLLESLNNDLEQVAWTWGPQRGGAVAWSRSRFRRSTPQTASAQPRCRLGRPLLRTTPGVAPEHPMKATDSVASITAIGGVDPDHPLASTTMASTPKKMMCRREVDAISLNRIGSLRKLYQKVDQSQGFPWICETRSEMSQKGPKK